jgi:hypothetical protein
LLRYVAIIGRNVEGQLDSPSFLIIPQVMPKLAQVGSC